MAFVAYSLGHLARLDLAGNLIGAKRFLPLPLPSMILGLTCLTVFGAAWMSWAFLGLLGFAFDAGVVA